MDEAVGWLLTELADDVRSGPFAIFGHSLGAMMGFQLTHGLARHGLPMPERLFLSAARPPHRRGPGHLHGLPDEALLTELARLKGAPAELLEHEEFRQVLLPVVRADLRIAETWPGPEALPLTVPVSLLSGRDDPLAPAAEVAHWRPYFAGDVVHREYGGDHFFVRARRDELLTELQTGLLEQAR
jgi:medium-chain acyl-[acyl-carrier-protein] hydrolase